MDNFLKGKEKVYVKKSFTELLYMVGSRHGAKYM